MKYQNKEFLITELIENKKSCCKLSKELKLSRVTIMNWIKEFGILELYKITRKEIAILNKKNLVAQKKYLNKRKLKYENKVLTGLSIVTFNEFIKIRKKLGITNEILMVELLQKFKGN